MFAQLNTNLGSKPGLRLNQHQTAMRSLLTLLLYLLYVCYGLTAVGVDAKGGRRGKSKARQRKTALQWRNSNLVDDNKSEAVSGLVFGQDEYDGEVIENAPVGSLVLTISASQTGNGNEI